MDIRIPYIISRHNDMYTRNFHGLTVPAVDPGVVIPLLPIFCSTYTETKRTIFNTSLSLRRYRPHGMFAIFQSFCTARTTIGNYGCPKCCAKSTSFSVAVCLNDANSVLVYLAWRMRRWQ